MMVMQNMDELFDLDIPRDWIAANHACVCNIAKAPWAPVDWLVVPLDEASSCLLILPFPHATGFLKTAHTRRSGIPLRLLSQHLFCRPRYEHTLY